MTDVLLPEILRLLDLVIIERRSDQTFTMVTPAPDWLTHAFEQAPVGARSTLSGAFPFLDEFLPQAEPLWHDGRSGPVESGPFAATVGGHELLLVASARTVDLRRILILERLTGDADTRPILQRARELRLEQEQLVRRITALHAPAATIADRVARLLGMALTPEQQALVSDLRKASADVQTALAELPAPDPRAAGQTARARGTRDGR